MQWCIIPIRKNSVPIHNRKTMPPEFIEPYAGFELIVGEAIVTREYQQAKLAALGLDARVYGDYVDPSFYIGLGIHAGIESGISAEGNVNMLSKIMLHKPIMLGETLISRGTIRSVEPVPRGRRVSTDVWFEDVSGNRSISVPRESLKPDLQKQKAKKRKVDKRTVKGAGKRPPPLIEDVSSLKILSEHQLTPEGTKAYSSEGNAIHYEMAAANTAGFRAPIIGGGQGVHFLMLQLWQKGLSGIDLDIYFRRPVFWDDHVQVGISTNKAAIALVKDNKVLTEARINDFTEME